jgi:SAM-dependent methyltransferase
MGFSNELYNLFAFRPFYNIKQKILIILICIMVSILVWKKYKQNYFNHKYEGFTQSKSFVLKTNENIYDGFYCDIYDIIHKTSKHSIGEIKQIIDVTQPSIQNSVFLDIGCGTGITLEILTKMGYNAFGIDKSLSMCKYASANNPEINVEYGDIMDTMAVNKNIFTHILCLYFTVYEIEDKITFFRNCYHWLKPGGYLIVHLIDPDKFSRIVPCNQNALFVNNKVSDKNEISFFDFTYKYEYKESNHSDKDNNIMYLKETFTDTKTGHMRQNENRLFVEPISNILKKASTNGFILKGKYNIQEYQDNNQYIYIFERML